MVSLYESPVGPLDNKLGAAFIGFLMAAILYGITCAQTYRYLGHSRRDKPFFKGVIVFLWLLDTLHIAFISQGLYFFMVSNFGNFPALASIPWGIIGQIYITGLSDAIIRYIFGQRVWKLTGRNYFIAIAMVLTSGVSFVSGFVFATRACTMTEFVNLAKISYLLYMSFGGAVVADCLIAGFLCFSLHGQRTGFKKTDSLVTVLMVYAINTSLLTTIGSIACFITYAVWPDEFTYIGIYFSMSKLFLNSLLGMLNRRDSLSQRFGGVSNISQLSNMGGDLAGSTESKAGPVHQSVVITINQEVVDDIEMNSTTKFRPQTL